MNALEYSADLIEIVHLDEQMVMIAQYYPAQDLHALRNELLKEQIQQALAPLWRIDPGFVFVASCCQQIKGLIPDWMGWLVRWIFYLFPLDRTLPELVTV